HETVPDRRTAVHGDVARHARLLRAVLDEGALLGIHTTGVGEHRMHGPAALLEVGHAETGVEAAGEGEDDVFAHGLRIQVGEVSVGRNDDARFAAHREIHGVGDEAGVVRSLVGGQRLAGIAVGPDGDHRAQHHLGEVAAIAFGGHRAFGAVVVGNDHHAGHGGHVQVGQHVAGGERGHQHVFRIVPRGIATEGGIGRAGKVRLAGYADHVVAAVVAIAVGASAAVAGPFHVDAVAMRVVHAF